MKLELDLEVIRREGEKKEKENYTFQRFLKNRGSEKVDAIAHRLNKEITENIDCTRCGNCCKFLRPTLTEEEIKRLARIDNVSPEAFEKQNVAKDTLDNTKYLNLAPCKYLEDKKCTIYSDRPEDCRSYPHTHIPDFVFRTLGMIANYSYCPIVYNLIEQMKMEMGFRY